MANLFKELKAFCLEDNNLFRSRHRGRPLFDHHLRAFFESTMDEVRLYHASMCGLHLLRITDQEEVDHFRQGVLRRELTNSVAYSKQRDHFAHTLYNYLLGWYVVSHCQPIQNAIRKCFLQRRLADVEWLADFASCWPYVSLLHDIGYILEGSISPLSTETQSAHAEIGLNVLRDFFDHRLWVMWKMPSLQARRELRKLSGTIDPNFNVTTLSGIADSLRLLGDLDRLRLAAFTPIGKTTPVPADDRLRTGPLPYDAFELWELNYRAFGFTGMADRIRWLEKVFEFLLYSGLAGQGIRLLDHGVCSGLILLLHTTTFYSTFFGVDITPPSDPHSLEVWKRFREEVVAPGVVTEAYWWWAGLVWATAACAIHNCQQLPLSLLPEELRDRKKLSLDEDPLAYLGILVDCVQEWDRYTSSQESVIAGALPLQGTDVQLRHKDNKIVIGLPHDFAKAATTGLDRSLEDWSRYLRIHEVPKRRP